MCLLQKYCKFFRFLADHGANLEDVDSSGVTPLMAACRAGRIDNARFIVDRLRAARGDDVDARMGVAGVNRQAWDSWSALYFAVVGGHLDVVKYLIQECAANTERALNARNEKRTLLMIAAGRADLPMVRYLLGYCKAARPDRYKRTALTHACMNGAAAVATHLLRSGMPVDRCDTSGNTDLHYACAYGWFHCVTALVEAGADLNAANEWRLTPVAAAIRKGHEGIARYLLEQPGVDVNQRDDDGKTILLSLLSDAGQEMPLTQGLLDEVVELVERRGADPTLVDREARGALHYLCGYRHVPDSNLQVEEEKERTGDEGI